MIWELIEWCTKEEYVFSMEWKEGGDMVWWDNRYTLRISGTNGKTDESGRQSMHRANPYTEDMTARDVRRSTVVDDGPLAHGVSKD